MVENLVRRSVDRGPTVRQRIFDHLQSIVENMVDDYGRGEEAVWRNVYRGDMDKIPNDVLPAASIDFGTEEVIKEIAPATTYELPVFFYFRFAGKRGVDEHDLYQYYLGLLQMTVLADNNLGGLTLDVREESNTHTIIGISDVYSGGVLLTVVKYRTRLHNPYRLLSEPA